MHTPHGLEIIESCLFCPHREDRLFCNLPQATLQRLSEITIVASYPKGATLFVEGQSPRGIFIVCAGRVKLSTSSSDGRTLILRVTDSGEVLGLAAAVSGKPYHATADVLEPSQVNFIQKTEFLRFLSQHGEAALRVAQQLSENYQTALIEMKMMFLSHSAAEKLARFLLDLVKEHNIDGRDMKVNLRLKHAEIAEMIGASRETVTRLFSDFKNKKLLQVKGSTPIITNKSGLQNIVDT
jgi:CRP/FNR family transcriptional regulator, cyclic AMP receptor protein